MKIVFHEADNNTLSAFLNRRIYKSERKVKLLWQRNLFIARQKRLENLKKT